MTTQYVNEAEECDTVALISDGRLIALARPDDLRREAMGGDVVEIETSATTSTAQASRRCRSSGASSGAERNGLRVMVDDASTAMPGGRRGDHRSVAVR